MVARQLNTPVVFIIFNRPDTTARVFDAIRLARPPKLLVVADGPRSNKPGEDEKCATARNIIERVDWDCEVLTNYSSINLGCKRRVSTGLDWAFNTVDEAIILEDDCLPDRSFFRFCEELLERYREDTRISQICGTNFQFGRQRTQASYYFSRYNHLWGWATWRRAWHYYDVDASIWPEFRDGDWISTFIRDSSEKRFWATAFQTVHEKRLDTWDYQWILVTWAQNMLSIIPNANLVSNIGFGSDATHTKFESIYANMQITPLSFPLNHSSIILPNTEADLYTAKGMFRASFAGRAFQKLKNLIR